MLFVVVGGPAGTGKSTLAKELSKHLACPFIEGDALHPKENVDKMSKGIPLTDDDRWGWLQKLSEETADQCEKYKTCIVSCSMLKKSYREYIEKCASERFKNAEKVTFRFIFLHTTIEELLHRVGNRKGHFMKSDMVTSQYDIMEIPRGDELVENGGHCLEVDTAGKNQQQVFEITKAKLS